MSSPTMALAFVRGIHIAVHNHEPATHEEWLAYFDDIASHLEEMQGLLVVAHGFGPDRKMRDEANAFWKKAAHKPPIAVLTNTSFVRVAANLLSWALGERIKAFKLTEFDAGFDHLAVPPAARQELLAAVRELRGRLGLKD